MEYRSAVRRRLCASPACRCRALRGRSSCPHARPQIHLARCWVSAFRGASQEALHAFIRAVESKKIAKGSYLLIESTDPLSRQAPMRALNRLEALTRLGVYVVTLSDGKRYDAKSFESEDVTDLLTALLHAHRAHSESLVKSRRVREALAAKRKRAQETRAPLGSICPSWLKLETGRYVVQKDKAKVVMRVFEMAASGQGNTAVAKRLNRDHVPVISGRATAWSAGSVGQLLASRTVLGEYEPHRTEIDAETGKRTRVPDGEPVPGMYPAVVPAALFLRVQRGREKRRIPSGPRGESVSNLFTGLLRCECGGRIHLVAKRRDQAIGSLVKYLSCANRINGSQCMAQAWPYHKTEPLLLTLLSRVIPWARLLPQTKSEAQHRSIF